MASCIPPIEVLICCAGFTFRKGRAVEVLLATYRQDALRDSLRFRSGHASATLELRREVPDITQG
jgi:hypothetical protein